MIFIRMFRMVLMSMVMIELIRLELSPTDQRLVAIIRDPILDRDKNVLAMILI